MVPFPLSLNISSSILHVHLLLPLPLYLLQPLPLLLIPLPLIPLLLLDPRVHRLYLALILRLRLLYRLPLVIQHLHLLLPKLVLLVRGLVNYLNPLPQELPDPLAHHVLRLQLLRQQRDPLRKPLLLLVEEPRQRRQLPSRLSLSVLHVELLLGLRLVDLLLQVEDLLVVLVRLLRVLVLRPLEVVVQPLDLLVQVLLAVAEQVELALGVEARADVLAELGEGEVAKLRVQELELLNQVVFILLDLFLVAVHVRIVLKLPH